jgi:NitT/TauT family transport system substrate-binding protein
MPLNRRDVVGLGLGSLAAAALPRAAQAAYSLEIMAPYYKSLITMAPIAVALELGLYAKHGVDVTGVVTSVGGGTGIRNMIGGGLPYAEMGTASVLAGFKAGLDVRIIHNSITTVRDILWITMPNSPINSIKDLAGKKIGISAPRSTSETLAVFALEAAGMAGQAKLVAIGPVGAGLSALENGGVDCTFILEPLYSQRKDKYKIAFTLDDLPPMSQNVGIATTDMIKQHPQELKAIIAARREAVDFIYANIEEAARITSKRYGDTLPADVAPIAMKRMAGIGYWSRGNIDPVGLNTVVKALERQGEWQGPADWEKIVDRSFLPDDLKA